MLNQLDQWLFESSGLTAHGFCLLWEPGLIWTYAVSDIVIALSYFSIPAALIFVARRRRDLVFKPVLWMFAAFILLCGTTHILDLVTLWQPAYGLQGVFKATTAVVSLLTAASLWWLMPHLLALPSVAQLREANAALVASREQLAHAQRIEAIGKLTGGIAHDFNNLLQAIMSSVTLLERRIRDGRIKETDRYLETIRHASDTAASLTARLLAFSRRQVLEPKRIDLDGLIKSLEDLLRRTLGPSIQLDLTLDDQNWSAICDPGQLENGLLNLAINARDAMPDGGRLTIATAYRRLDAIEAANDGVEPGDYVEITVGDTGVGIPPEILPRVFEPFFTTKPIGEGTGLGLSQVYGFVKQTGGFIQVESRVDQGTRITLLLPGQLPVETGALISGEPDKMASPAPASRRTKMVLLVEDQDAVRQQLAETLIESGFTVADVEDASQGLRLLESGAPIDLIVTDVGLPGMNGRQFADAARVIDPNLPVLLITGYTGTAFDKMQLPTGMEILRKPFQLADLVKRVGELLGHDQLTDRRIA